MKRIIFSLSIVCLFSNTITTSHAESIKVFDGLKKIIELSNKKSSTSNKDTPTNSSSTQYLTVSNAAEYCEKLKTNPTLNNFSNTIFEIRRGGWQVSESNNYYLDTKDKLLAQWVRKSLENDIHQTHNVYVPIIKWVNQCLYDSSGPTSTVLYTIEPDVREHTRVIQNIKKYDEKIEAQKSRRTVDADGNLTVQQPNTNELPNFVYSPSHSNNLDQYSPHWPALIAIALPKGEAVLEKLTSDIPNKIRQAAIEENKQNIAKSEKEEEIKQANEKEAIALNKATSDKDKQQNEFYNSPNGKLYLTYMYYSRVKSCFDVREGYMAVYITDKQYSNAKGQAKTIEKKLEPELTQNKDALWSKAVKSTDEFLLGSWYENTYLGVENYEFSVGKSACESYVKTLNSLASNILGEAPVEKGF